MSTIVRIRSTRILPLTLLLLALVTSGTAGATTAVAAPAFGSNVRVFDPSMPVSEIQATVDALHAQQVDAEMGTNRHALLFKPGVYGSPAEPLPEQPIDPHRGRI